MAPKDEDHEHWPENDKMQTAAAAPASRYDNHNGLHEHVYRPAGEAKGATPPPPEAAKKDAVQPQYYVPNYVHYPPQMAYGQAQFMAYPAPAYYGYGDNGAFHPFIPDPAAPPPAYAPNYVAQPAPAALVKDDAKDKPKPKPKDKDKDKPKPPSPRKWQGRTKAEVEEDDMKIAAKEGAYAARKVQPVGLAEDQVVWVVEGGGEGASVLRTFAEVKDFKGEWKADPRFKDSWYFVREAEKEKEKK